MQRLKNLPCACITSIVMAVGTGIFLGILATAFLVILIWGNL